MASNGVEEESANNVHNEDGAPKIDFLKDERWTMTYSRRIALSLMKYKWYNPHAGSNEGVVKDGVKENDGSAKESNEEASLATNYTANSAMNEKPNLEKAWAYFEHFALNRYVVDQDNPDSQDRKRAEPGEHEVPTRLYSTIMLPHDQLGDFGIGIGLYFSTLRLILILCLISGLISVANIHFFASEAYQPTTGRDTIFPVLTRGSAVCTEHSWVPCPSCECAQNERVSAHFLRRRDILPIDRCQEREVNGVTLRYVLKNDCGDVPIYVGMINYGTMIVFFLITYVYLGIFLRDQEVEFDEDEQTAKDYSIQVENPPESAKDPNEWHGFFKENFGHHVTVATCAVENDLLLHTLQQRRECFRHIELLMDPTESTDELNIARKAALIERDRGAIAKILAIVSPGIPEYYSKMVSLAAKVKGLAQLSYPCTNVFLTFETEAAQRDVLEKMSVGIVQAEKNVKTAVADPKYLFRGEHVLYVSEPEEPNTIRWEDLNVGVLQRIKSIIMTSIITMAGIVVVFIAVSAADSVSVVAGAYTITAFNTIFPMIAKALTNSEPHSSESAVQTSLYFKIAFFRWVSTAIVMAIITPFPRTLKPNGGLINKVYQQFFAEIVVSTALQLFDIMGHVDRHIKAPRAKCQDAMNLLFKGTPWNLAERYTDMTKILFLCVWYCSIYPAAYLLCAFSLFLKYYVDKFSLTRTWERAPHLGNAIAWISHGIFFPLALVATGIMSSYYWAGFPFDNLCLVGPLEGAEYGNPMQMEGFLEEINHEFEYEYCRQNFFGRDGTFPFIGKIKKGGAPWMTDDQEVVTTIFGWTSVVFCAAVLLKFVIGWVKVYQALHSSFYKPVGADKEIPFSTLDVASGYVPSVTSLVFSFPLIACISDEVESALFDWQDPDRPYKYYDLSEDARELLQGSPFDYKDGFSRIQFFPPSQEPKKVSNLTSSDKPIEPIPTEDGNWNSVISPEDA